VAIIARFFQVKGEDLKVKALDLRLRTLNRFFTRFLNFAIRCRGNERFGEEIESHITMQAEENIRASMVPDENRLKFGAEETVREGYRNEQGSPFVENLLLDIRYALRVLRKSPAFTVTALITLMLGIGANVVVFGVLNAVLLQPLDVSDPQSLYQIRHKPWMSGRLLTTSYPALEDFRQRNTTFSGMAGIYGYSGAKLSWHNAVRMAHGDEVTGNYFDLLGVQPEAGRFFHAADEHGPGSAPYVVLSDALWRTVFQADRSVVGTTVDPGRHPFTVVGVAPAQFHGAERFVWPDYWIPMVNEEQVERSDYLHSRTAITVTVIGRLKPGVTPLQATENLNAIAVELAREYPEADDGQPLRLIHPGLYGDNGDVIRGFLYSVTMLALLVLAAACANLATLFAARAADRSRELALRVALGSSRRRLVRQLLTEAVMLSLMGGAAGLVSAGLLLGVLNRSHPFVGQLTVSVDASVYLAGLALTLGSALLFGLVPAWQAWRSSPLQMMKGGPLAAVQMRRFALRDLLLGAQIAICTLLVTASLVAVRGMMRVLQVPLGFQPQGAMLADLDLSEVRQAGDTTVEKVRGMIEAMRSIPGVTAAGTVSRTPFTGGIHGIPIFPPGTTEFRLNNSVLATYVYQMSPGYLDAAGTRLLGGRDVSWHDTAKTPHVAIVNKTFARRMWGAQAASIGQRFILNGNPTEVVGVAEDGKYHDLEESPQPAVYLALSQSEQSGTVFVMRSRLTPGEMAAALVRTLSGIVPNVPVTVQTWPDAIADVLFPARAATVALGVMGLLAAMLAVTGIFGMAAYSVSRRKKELGIRVALGARRAQVMKAAVGRPVVLLGVGSVLGLMTGILASRLLGQIVYQANPRDPVVVGGAVLTMALLGIAASAIPAARALTVDPSGLLREE
jgi:predicted permease